MSDDAFVSETLRLIELDALSAILPMERRDHLAGLLSESDIATLKHLASAGMGANSLRALASDLAYLEAWGRAATGAALPWPAREPLILKFIAHHLWDAEQRAVDCAHGMPEPVAEVLIGSGHLRAPGPHAPATVKRRLSNWATLHRWRNLQGDFSAPGVRSALKLAVRANLRPRSRKSARAVTGDVLELLLATCTSNGLIDLRDRALLLLAFGSGGRRRSEIAKLRVEDLGDEPPIAAETGALPSLSLRLGRTKTTAANEDARAYVSGRPVVALKAWIERSGIASGPLFRAIDRWGKLKDRALTPQSVNLIVKQRCLAAGLDPSLYSAHGLRSGFLTEAARQGVPLPEAMRQSQHRSVQQAANYYNDAEQGASRAARLTG